MENTDTFEDDLELFIALVQVFAEDYEQCDPGISIVQMFGLQRRLDPDDPGYERDFRVILFAAACLWRMRDRG